MKIKEFTTVTYPCLEYFPPAYEEKSLISLLSKTKSEQVIGLQKFFLYICTRKFVNQEVPNHSSRKLCSQQLEHRLYNRKEGGF